MRNQLNIIATSFVVTLLIIVFFPLSVLNSVQFGALSLTDISGPDQISDFPTTYNANNALIEAQIDNLVGTTTHTTLTTANALTSASSLATIGTITTGVWNGTAIDISSYTNLTAGRSLTLSADSVIADAELYTDSFSFNVHATSSNLLATSTDPLLSKRVETAFTITSIDCYALDVGTSTMRAEIRSNPFTAGSDVLYGTGINCGAEEAIASSTLQNTAVAAGSYISLYVQDGEPTGQRPRMVNFVVNGQYDD